MIRGYRPSGYFETADGNGKRIEGETRACVHCQYTWEYQPGSGDRRGFCTRCLGFLCARPECEREQRRLLALFPERSLTCIPFDDVNKRLLEQYAQDPRYEVLPSGIVIARDY